jgi:hypothetical protein
MLIKLNKPKSVSRIGAKRSGVESYRKTMKEKKVNTETENQCKFVNHSSKQPSGGKNVCLFVFVTNIKKKMNRIKSNGF